MKKRFDSILNDRNGKPVSGINVAVRTVANHPNGALATIYSDEGITPAANPLTTNSLGYYEYYAADGDYSETIYGTGITTRFITDITIEDSMADLAASSGSSLVGDNTGGGLWTTVKGFITYLLSSAGASIVGFIQSGTGATASTVERKLRERRTIFDFIDNAVVPHSSILDGTNAVDLSSYIQAAFNDLTDGDGTLELYGTLLCNASITRTVGGMNIIGYRAILRGTNIAGYLLDLGTQASAQIQLSISGVNLEALGTSTGCLSISDITGPEISNLRMQGNGIGARIRGACYLGKLRNVRIQGDGASNKFDTCVKVESSTSGNTPNNLMLDTVWMSGQSKTGSRGFWSASGGGTGMKTKNCYYETLADRGFYIQSGANFTDEGGTYDNVSICGESDAVSTSVILPTSGSGNTDGFKLNGARSFSIILSGSANPTNNYVELYGGNGTCFSGFTSKAQNYSQQLALTGVVGTFTVGETITGGTSTATAVVRRVNGSTLHISGLGGAKEFTAAETVTGGTSGATGTISTNTAASGVITDLLNSVPIGPIRGFRYSSRVIAKTADYTVDPDESGMTFSNNGAGATRTITLPKSVAGMRFNFSRIAAQVLRVDPYSTEIIRGGGAGKYLSMDTTGAYVGLECVVAGTWELTSSVGTITYEP